MNWINISEKLPPIGVDVLFVSLQEPDDCTLPAIGCWTGERTMGNTIVMDYGEANDWYSCTHWIPIPPLPVSFA
jgi:hypothetical protein